MATLAQSIPLGTAFDVYGATCPSRALLDLVTGRWAVLLIGALEERPQRFGALRRRLEGVSQKVLTEKLRDLEAEGLVSRTVVDRPLAVYYELTPLGHGLVQPLAALREWAQTHCDGRPVGEQL
ncbi:MAG: helix-turn-helix domain-containing protein [Actinoplanes sp.]